MAAFDRIPCGGGSESTQYDIIVGNSLLQSRYLVQDILSSHSSTSSFLILTDTNLLPLYGDALLSMFKEEFAKQNATDCKSVFIHAISAGEASKSRETKAFIEDNVLFPNRFHRDSCIIALGGGVVGDLSGYIAATYMRGISFVQVPTSLLAIVDSSIGGKTGIDVPAFGKNLLGSFHMPKRVYIDLSMLETLPDREFVNGMAEIIKAGAIYDAELFELLELHQDKILGRIAKTCDRDMEIVQRMVRMAVLVKTRVVTEDTKERGLRAILNFGHSIGHAYEALLQPHYLHGECVAIGMMKEAEIARGLGKCSSTTVGRLRRCLQDYHLPVKAPKDISLDKVLEKMEIDKKNGQGQKRIVLLQSIGQIVSSPAYITAVKDETICLALEQSVMVESGFVASGKVIVPGSKSISNRVLLMAALGRGTCRIKGLLHSDDTQVMMAALSKLGAHFRWEENGTILSVQGTAGNFQPLQGKTEIYLSNAGTAARFLTTTMALAQTRDSGDSIIVTGDLRMQERPIGPLVAALRSNGCQIDFIGANEGCPPLAIQSTGLKGGLIRLGAQVSSQYVSSILLNAPYAASPVTLHLNEEQPISLPYILMTVSLMKQFGIDVTMEANNRYTIPTGSYNNPATFDVEVDASSATYPLALAAITGGNVRVESLGNTSLQGDASFHKALRDMGCETLQTESTTTVIGPPKGTPLKAIELIDMESMTDAFMTLAALAAVAEGTTKIVGIANQRVKECNRIQVMVTELTKLGIECGEIADGMWIKGTGGCTDQLRKAHIQCYNDHRIAMSFAVLGAYVPNVIITEKACTEKTFPEFWDRLQLDLGLRVQAMTSEKTEIVSELQTVPAVFLIGMRGSGKTTLGQIAAKTLNMGFLDTDKMLEKRIGMSVPEFVEQEGGNWSKFREQEQTLLLELLSNPPKNTILSCGGGIVESKSVCTELAAYAYVVHIRQNDMKKLIALLDGQESLNTRPSLGLPHDEVYKHRKPLYDGCSSFEFVVAEEDASQNVADSIKGSADAFVRFLNVVLPNHASSMDHRTVCVRDSFFLSLTYPDVRDAFPIMQTITEGVEAVELRVDLLKSIEPMFVAAQVAYLRLVTPLPIIFTVRSMSQGGSFADQQEGKMFELLHLAVRLGCEFVDMETCWALELQSKLINGRKRSAIIASLHAVSHNSSMSEQEIASILRSSYHSGQVQIVKVVCKAFCPDDALLVHRVARDCRRDWNKDVPVIALCTTDAGKLSRVMNDILTPVTHELLPQAAAPGQLSVWEILRLRKELGFLPPRRFYLIGSPIQKSLSPAMHNAAFQAQKLPFQYELCDTLDLSRIAELIRNSDTFGGASVTIPHKVDIMKLLDDISPAARAIGAVNTVIRQDRISGMRLRGENTDWLGIQRPIRKRLQMRAISKPASSLQALIIGAGGTAMAAAYAMRQLGVKNLNIHNRTLSKAQYIADRFHAKAVEDLSSNLNPRFDVVIGTIPASAGFTLPPNLIKADSIVLDAAYSSSTTPMIQALLSEGIVDSANMIKGYEMLYEQGYEQYRLWHKFTHYPAKKRESKRGDWDEIDVYPLMKRACQAKDLPLKSGNEPAVAVEARKA